MTLAVKPHITQYINLIAHKIID